ncbi:MAG: replicative DNA helicase [Candidatus Hydrothermales bacterium]
MKEEKFKIPFDIEIERTILGSMFVLENAATKAFEQLKEEMFYEPSHRDIYRAMIKTMDKRKKLDPINVAEVLEKENILNKIGGIEYLVELEEYAINPSYIDDYIKSLTEKYILRKTIELCYDTIRKCESGEEEAEEILYDLDKKIFEIAQIKIREGLLPIGEVLKLYISEIKGKEGEGVHGIFTGYTKFDELTGGFHPGEFVVVASRPSVGKTSFILNLIYRLAKFYNIPSALFSIEMSKIHIAMRFLILESEIDSIKFRNLSSLSESETRRLLEAANRIENLPIFIDDTPSISIQELRAKARRAVLEHKVKIIFIDYIQLIQGPSSESKQRFENRPRELAYITDSLKKLARELNVPVVALSQLSRKAEERKEEDAAPKLSDLRESGALEQDADIVLFLYKKQDEYEIFEPTEPYAENFIRFYVAKNRNGPQGKFALIFRKEFMKFENPSREYYPVEESGIPF